MWQFLLAAAAAGSGFLAGRLCSANGDSVAGRVPERTECCEEVVEAAEEQQQQPSVDPLKPNFFISPLGLLSPLASTGLNEVDDSWNWETQGLTVGEDGIFRFSSLDSGNVRTGAQSGLKSSRKKAKVRSSRDGVKKRIRVPKNEKKSCSTDDNGMAVVGDQRKRGKNFSFCLKKRRTGKNANARCGSSSTTEGSSSFGWGLGLGIMYTVAAGKAEINKLNAAVNETAKAINEMKAELHKRKLSRDLLFPSFINETDANSMKAGDKHSQQDITPSKAAERDPVDLKILCLSSTGSGDAGSVLTEEPGTEMFKFDQLEAELESELQKIPLYTTEVACCDEQSRSKLGKLGSENVMDMINTEVSANVLKAPHELEGMDSNYYQFHGVSPTELDQKLCHVLIEQQESHIMELESELHIAQGKVNEKEAELQALKECVRRLTDFSLATGSDEETEDSYKQKVIQESTGVNDPNQMGPVEQKPLVGMKRMMEF